MASRKGKVRIDDPHEFLTKARKMIREVHGVRAEEDITSREFDPLMTMAVAATDPNVPLQSRAKIAKDLSEFLYAKKKAVEVDADFASDMTMQVVVWGQDGPIPIAGNARRQALGHDEPQVQALEYSDERDVEPAGRPDPDEGDAG